VGAVVDKGVWEAVTVELSDVVEELASEVVDRRVHSMVETTVWGSVFEEMKELR
jgi:hypothetical protein